MKVEYKGGDNRKALLRRESGQLLVLGALSLIVLCGMAALAVDIGHGLVVRHELQNAADASALAGAGNLFPDGPDWTRAEASASSSISWNKSDGQFLSDCQVQSGYWNLDQIPPGLQSQSIIPGPRDVPAVIVTVQKAGGDNGGPMPTAFAKVLGIFDIPLQARAVAVVNAPGYVNPGVLFPVAITEDLAKFFMYHTDPSNTVVIGSPYHYENKLAGQWTSFLDDINDVNTLRSLIDDGNTEQININASRECTPENENNDCIWIQPGTENTLYDNPNESSVVQYVDKVVVLPVVGGELSESTHGMAPVVGFLGFHVISSIGQNQKQITGYFEPNFTIWGSGGSGPYYGAHAPLQLVR